MPDATGLAPVNAASSSRVVLVLIERSLAPVNAASSSRVFPVLIERSLAPVSSESSSRLPVTGTAPVTSESSSDAVVVLLTADGSSPVSVFSSSRTVLIVNLETYPGEESEILIPIKLSGIMNPIFPPPTPPVDFAGLSNPTATPTVTKSTTTNGRLTPGAYRYSYAAWKGSQAQVTVPSPYSEVTLTTENTVTLTYPVIAGADGYVVYREEL